MIQGTLTDKKTPWTRFMDMHSGGGCKEGDHQYIYIQAPEKEAELIFYNRFGHNPHRVTCTCCGSDYSIDERDTLEEASGYDRNCDCDAVTHKYVERARPVTYGRKDLITVAEYVKRKDVLAICSDDIKDDEREGSMPRQGYVWHDDE